MNIEKAIDILKSRSVCMECVISKYDCDACDEAFEMAISALEQEPCEDAISRAAVIRLIRNENSALKDIFITHSAGEELSRQINELPSVTPSRRKGHWIKSRDSYGNNHFTCSECGNDIATQYADDWHDNYCNECGADMR